MKTMNKWRCTALILALFICGCADTMDRENMLSAAGFRTVVATTPAQRQQLQTLRQDRVTPVRHGSEIAYIYPDPQQNTLYVGHEANYQAYRKMRLQKQMADENLEAAQMWSQPTWGAWGPWGGWWY